MNIFLLNKIFSSQGWIQNPANCKSHGLDCLFLIKVLKDNNMLEMIVLDDIKKELTLLIILKYLKN